jgi:NADH-quinone oxidoreductase subunit H
VTIAHHVVELQVADPPIGILFLLALSSIAVYGVMLAGWSSGSKYPLLGSVRASAQMISYEAALGLAIVTVILESHGLSTRTIVDSQARHFWDWNVLRLWFVPFVIFFVAGTAELNRPPFDLAEGESELGGGFHTEYSSMRFLMFYLAEFMNTITMSAVVVTLFFGGPDGPGFKVVRWLWPILWFLGKTVVFLYIQVWIRASLPRLRYDQLMNLGWKWLIPVALGWLLLVAAVQVSRTWGFGVFGGIIVGAVLLALARSTSRRRGELGRAGPRPPEGFERLGVSPAVADRPPAGG